jgi:hypothetical protein
LQNSNNSKGEAMKKLVSVIAGLAAVPVVAMAVPVNATVQPSIEGGDIYRVKNVTKNIDFTDPVNADACDLLMYKVRIHNPGPVALTNVRVQAAFQTAASTSNKSIITVRADNASPSNTSDTATANLSSSQTLSYVSGSTQLLDANGNVISTLSDGITQGGVSIGSVGVSINEKRFVQFQEKVNCPTPTPTPTPTTPTAVKGTTTIPNTGPGAVAGLFAGASALGMAGHYAIRRRRA